MSIHTEPPPTKTETGSADLELGFGEDTIDLGNEGLSTDRPAFTVSRWLGSTPADRLSRILVVIVAAAVGWLLVARPEPWERFVVALALVVALTRIRWIRRLRPVAALLRPIDVARGSLLRHGGLLGRAILWWRAAPTVGKLIVASLLALNPLIAAVLLQSNVAVFLAMVCLNFVVLALTPPVDIGPEPDTVSLRSSQDHSDGELGGDRAGSSQGGPDRNAADRGTTASPKLISISALRPFPTLHAPGWDTWESWESLKQPVSPDLAAPPPCEPATSPSILVGHDGAHTSSAAAKEDIPEPDTSVPAEVLESGDVPSRFRRILDRLRPVVGIGVLVVACGWIAYSHPGPLLVPCVLVVGAALVGVNRAGRDEAIRMVLAIGVVVAGIDYISWRFVVINWSGWWIAIPLLAAETLGAIHVLGFQLTLWPWPSPETREIEDPTQHPVFILIPTLNEGVEVLRPTIEACIVARDRYLIRFPHARVRVIVCNDGRAAGFPEWKEVESLARSLGAACISRRHPGGAKAGNIEHARRCFRITRDALVVIFDADQAPAPEFLLKTIPHFAEPKVGWVQTGQYYANRNNPVSRWADDQQSLFYNLLCPGKAAHNSAFICGTNVVVRASALDQIGGLPQDSVTEDFAASIALHPNWQSVYLTEVLATGLGPLDLPSYLKQQRRWAVGTLGVLRTNWRDIFLPKRRRGLRPAQRIQYFLACTHYMSGVRDLIYLVCPMLFIATGVPAVRSASLGQYLSHFLPYGILSYSALWYAARGVTGLRGIVMSFGSFPTLVGSLLTVVRGRKASFSVTSKRRHAKPSLRYLYVYVIAAVACVVTIIWATRVGARQQASMFISLWWVIYTLLMLGAFLWLAVRDLRLQTAQSRAGSPESTDKVHYRSRLEQRPIGLRPVWNLAAAAVLATPLLLGSQLKSAGIFHRTPPPPFAISAGEPGTPYAGVSIPAQLLSSQAQLVQTDLNGSAGVVGRTIDLSDRFPTGWADRSSSGGTRPWISLQFGEFGAGNTVPLEASLPAIINGVDDNALRRWASEIRSYGKPVYLTILTQADRNWSVSSGVANGGIPEDVPKAWLHVQSIFRSHGVRNVAWVWAPADPIHDQQFAPPARSIDAVLQTFVNYPGTTWGQPAVVLHHLEQRYPGKPIFVDVSVDGPSAMKAAWLAALGQAVHSAPDVHAVLYHEGGPDLNPTAEELTQWSAASDPASLAAWRSDLSGFATATSHGGSAHQPATVSG